MANTILKLTSILILLTLLAMHNSKFASSTDIDQDHDDDLDMNEEEGEEEEEYVLDTPLPYLGSRSRFLAASNKIKKGRQCDVKTNNICNGVKANKGRDLLFCCKNHCRNVLSDKNHCNVCGNRCKGGQRCCNGVCTNVLSNADHCGKCNKKCSPGDSCGNGVCGYA